ncbi:hypothetical protein SYYSPA8_36775 (plasmid) [Streptomyces yaizuensis]|uniref:Uncharacterized protein n=2 Tax=Streptomyces yaizuensis TaxID=2989713 RepID=A0AA86MBG0_9ACTN|nr:hypothetical protein SYYSPA8_36775 [Streptomyces sp. YSPA8]
MTQHRADWLASAAGLECPCTSPDEDDCGVCGENCSCHWVRLRALPGVVLTYENQYRPGSSPGVWLTSGRAWTITTLATMGDLATRVLRDTLAQVDSDDAYEWRVLVWDGRHRFGDAVVRTEEELTP